MWKIKVRQENIDEETKGLERNSEQIQLPKSKRNQTGHESGALGCWRRLKLNVRTNTICNAVNLCIHLRVKSVHKAPNLS